MTTRRSAPYVSNRFVLDASIAMKWYMSDEEDVEQSNLLRRAYHVGRVELLAPNHILYEVSNALHSSVRRGRLSAMEARDCLNSFIEEAVPVVQGSWLLEDAWNAADRYSCKFYDGLYVALAERTGSRLIHADRRLHNTLAGQFDLELWIEDFVLEA